METSDKTARIRELNNELRHTMDSRYGDVMLTKGVLALGQPAVGEALEQVKKFREFTEDNDPHGEHDCACFKVHATDLMWKIDYYDNALTWGSPDPSDPAVTRRVLTILLVEEY